VDCWFSSFDFPVLDCHFVRAYQLPYLPLEQAKIEPSLSNMVTNRK